MLVGSRYNDNNHPLGEHRHFFAINQALTLHQGPILEFTLSMGTVMNYIKIDQIIFRLSRNTTLKKLTLNTYGDYYKLPSLFWSLQQLTHLNIRHCELHPTSPFYSLQQLTHLSLKHCHFQPPSTFNGFDMLTSLYLHGVSITDPKVLLHFISGCPILKHFTLCGLHIKSAFPKESSIFDQLFKCLHAIEYLNLLTYYSVMWCFTGGVPRMLPTSLVLLKHLNLSFWQLMKENELRVTLLLIRSSPNLKKIKIENILTEDVMEEIMVFNVLKDYADVKLDHLIEFEIENFTNSFAESELLKLILVKSPMLKKLHLRFNNVGSDKEEIKMLRSFLRLPRASPVEIIVR